MLPHPAYTPAPFPAADTDAMASVVPADTTGKRSKGKMAGGLIAVVALLGAGGFAVTKIVAGAHGGAGSPTEVGTRLMDSLAAEDALGVVDLLLPGERDTMRQPLIDIVDNLKRLGIADKGASLSKVGGLDIAFEGVDVETTNTNVDDISDIRIRATGTASVDGATVPIGDLLIDEAFGGHRPDLHSDAQTSDVDWKLATVKRDGRWYLSAFYSIAENARAGVGDIPTTGIVAHGANTPDGAVQAVFDAVHDLDVSALIATLNPNEAEALQRYSPMFVDAAQSTLDGLDAKIAFSDVKLTVNGDGDRRSVAVDGFKMTASGQGTDVTVDDHDGCMVITSNDTTIDSCKVAGTLNDAFGVLGLDKNEDVKSLVKTIQDAFSDMKPIGITVQNVDGKWYVSPIGTSLDILLAELTALDKNDLTAIIDGIKKVVASLSTDGGLLGGESVGGIFNGDVTGDSSSSIPDDSATTVPVDDSASNTSIGDTGDTSDTIGTGDSSGFDTCFDATDYTAYTDCLRAGLADGSIDPAFVAPYFRFPECGVGEAYWSADVYTMSDADFTAMATAAAPCFQKHVADGTVSAVDLPYELYRPECLEGKNWYNVSDDDYTGRVFACVAA